MLAMGQVPTDSGTKAEVVFLLSQGSVQVRQLGTEADVLAGQGQRHSVDPCALYWGHEASSRRASTVVLARHVALGM